MVQRYRGHTIVTKPDKPDKPDNTGGRPGVVVFEGDSDEVLGEFDSVDDARSALDRRAQSTHEPQTP